MLFNAIKVSNEEEIKKIISANPELLNEPISDKGDYTALNLAIFLGKIESVKILIDLSCDVNLPSGKDLNSPLMISAMRNRLSIFNLLLDKGALFNYYNKNRLNCLDIAILFGYYEIAYNIFILGSLELKPLEEYVKLSTELKTPLFNMTLFYSTLENKVLPKNAPIFSAPREMETKYIGKIPDPNESWTSFLKRVGTFQLANPPLVNVEDVALEKRKTLFVRSQTKFIENQYGLKLFENEKKEGS